LLCQFAEMNQLEFQRILGSRKIPICPYSQNGQLPDLVPLDENNPGYSPDKGKPGDLCPPCAKQQLANLEHWQGHGQQTFPEELLPLRLFKCRMWLWLVIPSLYDAEPTQLMTVN